MDTFRVALSHDFMKPDGSPAFPSFDLTPLSEDPRISWDYVPVKDGRVDKADMAGFDALIMLGARFDADSFPGDGRLSMVARFGVGYDNVDIPACDANDVALVITPSGVRRPVAVAILTLVLALAGRLFTKDRLTRQGPEGWAKRAEHMGQGLVGLTLGSIGIGNIGAEMFRLAAPFGLRFVAHDPYADRDVAASLGVELVSLEEVYGRSDFVCVNCPWTDETTGLVNADGFARMKSTAFLINTARGPIVDEAALVDALRRGAIAGAGLDVFEQEPTAPDNPLHAMDNVILTPHALCWTDQCFANIGAADVEAVRTLMTGGVPEGIVNGPIVDNDAWKAKLAGYADRFSRGG